MAQRRSGIQNLIAPSFRAMVAALALTLSFASPACADPIQITYTLLATSGGHQQCQ